MSTKTTGQRILFTLRGDRGVQHVCVCQEHAREMPSTDGDRVTAEAADDDLECEFCV